MQPGGPLSIANDAALTSAGFRSFVPFHDGTLRLTGDWTTTRHLSMLAGGGTIDTNGFNATVNGNVINDGQLTKIGAGTLTLRRHEHARGRHGRQCRHAHGDGHITTAPSTVTGGTLRGHGIVGDVTLGDATWAPARGALASCDGGSNVTMSAGDDAGDTPGRPRARRGPRCDVEQRPRRDQRRASRGRAGVRAAAARDFRF